MSLIKDSSIKPCINDTSIENFAPSRPNIIPNNSFIKKKRKRIKFKKISKVKKRPNQETPSIPSKKVESKNSDLTSEYSSGKSQTSSEFSEETVKSLTQLQIESLKKNRKQFSIKNIKTGEKIELLEIVKLFKLKDKANLIKYKFPYMSQNDFNYNIYNIDIKVLRSLYFACPKCEAPYRHFSMAFHIFQNHFENIEEILSKRDIAHSCAKLMENEFKKIENSLEIFSELAIIYKTCEFTGDSAWRTNINYKIETLKQLNIEKKFFRISKEEAFHLLDKRLPLNKNKRYKK